MTRRQKHPTVNDLGEALCAALLLAQHRGDPTRATKVQGLLDELLAAMRAVKADADRIGLHWTGDQSLPSGIRAWRTMADDYDSAGAWRAAADAFRALERVSTNVERALAEFDR